MHPFVNLLVTGGSDEDVYEGEDLEFEEEIGYIKVCHKHKEKDALLINISTRSIIVIKI